MGEIIADILAQRLILLNFVTRAAGVFNPVSVKGSKLASANKIYANDGEVEICALGGEGYLTPDSKETGIIYFEDLGAKQTDNTKHLSRFTGELKLICWLNMKAIGSDNLIGAIAERLRIECNAQIAETGSIRAGACCVTEVYSKKDTHFNQFDYDQNRTQFLMYPYDSVILRVRYTVHVLNNCLVDVIINPIVC